MLPEEWIRISKGSTEIKSSVVAYLFDRYGDLYGDPERDELQQKLDFLGIVETDCLPGVRDRYLYVYVTFEETSA